MLEDVEQGRLDPQVAVQRLKQIHDHEQRGPDPHPEPQVHEKLADQVPVQEEARVPRSPEARGAPPGDRAPPDPRPRRDELPKPQERARPGRQRVPDAPAQQPQPDEPEHHRRGPDGHLGRQAAAHRDALEGRQHEVVRDEDDEAAHDRNASSAPMSPDSQGEADHHEDDRRDGKGKALVQLQEVRRRDLPLPREGPRRRDELDQVQVLLGLVQPRRALERALDREIHVVQAEGRVPVAQPRVRVGFVDRSVDEAEGDALVLLVGKEPPLACRDEPRKLRVPLVGHEEAAEPHLRGRDLLHVDHELAERGVEHPLLDPRGGPGLEDLEQLPLECVVRPGVHGQGEDGGRRHHGERHEEERHEEAQRAHARGLQRDDLQVRGQAAGGQQDRHQERHGERVSKERRQHVHEELEHEVEGNALGHDQIGEAVDPVDGQEERQEPHPQKEGGEELPEHVPIEQPVHHGFSAFCCTISP